MRVPVGPDLQVVDLVLHTGGIDARLDGVGLDRLCAQLQAPRNYVTRFPAPLMTQLLNAHLERRDHYRNVPRNGRLNMVVLRRVCSNTLTHRVCGAERSISRTRRMPRQHVLAASIQRDQVRQLARVVWRGLPSKLAEVVPLRTERVGKVEVFLAQLLRKAHLHKRQVMRCLKEALQAQEEQGTAYAALNAITYAATHRTELPARQRRALSALGGLLAHRHTHHCPQCYSVLGR